jgi:hypothetical protein
MEITSSTGKYADLQAIIAMARQKNAVLRPAEKISAASATFATKTAKSSNTITDVSVQSAKLVNRLYGSSEKKPEHTANRVGSRFDAYA